MTEPGSVQWRNSEAASLLAFIRGSARPGGGFGWLDNTGGLDLTRPRPLYVTSRMTYVFTLAGLVGDPDASTLAASGIGSLLGDYADSAHGGWFSSLDSGGHVLDSTKMNYAHAMTLLATSSALVAGIAGAEEAYAATVATIEKHFWSDDEGCAVETWNAGFTELEPYRGANSNMHSLEAYLAAADASGDPVWRERGLSIASRIIDTHARANGWRIPEHYDPAWRPLLEFNSDHRDDQFRPYGATPGHSFEWSRLLLGLEAALPDPPTWLAEAAVALFDRAVADGRPRNGGPGFVYTVDMNGEPVVTALLHWVICEAVLAADALHRRTGDARFADAQAQWWTEIDSYFLDRTGGSWWHELDENLRPAATTWTGKPDGYHSYQALLFPSLPLAPTAATALQRRRPGDGTTSA
jgi:sulfoquinovose isomerase